MAQLQTSVLKVQRQGPHLVATIDDPASRNAMTDALLADMLAVLAHIAQSGEIRSLVLRGSNSVFCAGADLKGNMRADVPVGSADPVYDLSKRGASLFHQLNACPVPVIAAINGSAFGGGFGMACCADIVLCGPNARFALSETRLGLIPAQVAPFVLGRIGLSATRRLALTGRRLGPEQAVSIGLADAAFADEAALDAAVDAYLGDIGQCAPVANARTKALLLSLSARWPDAAQFIDHAADLFAQSLRGPEGSEGVEAFGAKRKPNWIA